MISHLLLQSLIFALPADAPSGLICCSAEEVFILQAQPTQPERLARSWMSVCVHESHC